MEQQSTNKSEPMKPIEQDGIKFCPACGYELNYDEVMEASELYLDNKCYWCGQKLDFEGKAQGADILNEEE